MREAMSDIASKTVTPITRTGLVFAGILVAIFGLIILHAPLSIVFGSLFPDASLVIKAWKEILMMVAVPLGVIALYQTRQYKVLKDPVLMGIAIYGLLHVLSVGVFGLSVQQSIAGLLIDLRYVAFFALVYICIKLYPGLRSVFIKAGVIGALIALGFALLQVFLLPEDILKYIGYNLNTIMPYLTVDQNTDYIRINSTFRGPNPLGAYAVITLTTLVVFWLRGPREIVKRPKVYGAILAVGSLVALWASYSRSAWIAAVLALGIVWLVVYGHKTTKWVWLGLVSAAIVFAGMVYAFRDTSFVSNVILHEDPQESGQVNSNDGHIDSLQDGVYRLINQPFGAGVGSTGSASLLGENPLIIENQYLYIAHEVGWAGLALFLIIFGGILSRLWKARRDWLALSVFASGVGLAFIGLLLPVWVDDTVALIWWGLAAIALGSRRG